MCNNGISSVDQILLKVGPAACGPGCGMTAQRSGDPVLIFQDSHQLAPA